MSHVSHYRLVPVEPPAKGMMRTAALKVCIGCRTCVDSGGGGGQFICDQCVNFLRTHRIDHRHPELLLEKFRVEFEELMRSDQYLFDESHQLERDPNCGTYINPHVRRHWKLWKIAKNVSE